MTGPSGASGVLLSDAAPPVTGAELPVDGGLTGHGGVEPISDALREHA